MSERRDAAPPGALLSALIAILDIVVLERLDGGAFRQVGGEPSPNWFSDAFRDAAPEARATLAEAFPVLDPFLAEAEAFWNSRGYGRLDGEAFVVTGADGVNLALNAIAVALHGRCFLLIQRVAGFEDRQHILQRAREGALDRENLVKQIDTLRSPISRLSNLAADAAAGDTPQQLLSGLRAEIDALQRVLDTLPRLPPGSSPRRR